MYVWKPFTIELTCTPEAGKTTVINSLFEKLKKMGYNVKLYQESAEIVPKGSLDAKLWMKFETTKIIFLYNLKKYGII